MKLRVGAKHRNSTVAAALASAILLGGAAPASAQRVLGVDISYWNTGAYTGDGITQSMWNTGFSTGGRRFAFIRSSRGGTTGADQGQGTPAPENDGLSTLSRRYDDPRFVQNITRATTAGFYTAPYHYGRPDITSNTGTDEANHFMEMAGAWMRPGYLVPIFDLEGPINRTANGTVQFAIDFSNRIYNEMGIRPGIYVGGSYSNFLSGASASLRNQLAQPASNQPSVVSPAYPVLWNPLYEFQGNEGAPGIQTEHPKTHYSGFYGPFDDYGVAHPWSFWQYSSTSSIPGFNQVDSGIDSNVAQGDIEFLKDRLVPAVWMNNSTGDWSTLANWNSGQAAVAPIDAPDQATPYATGPLPTPRLPGAAGTGPTSGQHDTVILERPSANITVTLSSGSHNIRKLYMRESLDITGGSLNINYNPTYWSNPGYPNALRSGPISAQFSGPVSLSGTGSLSAHTLQVDATRTFTLSGGTLTFNKIHLMPHASSPATIAVDGNVIVNPLSNASAAIVNGTGGGSSGRIDLTGGDRVFNVGNGASAVDLSIDVPIINGGLTKSGAGTLALNAVNSYIGDTTVQAGTLSISNPFLADSADVFLSTGALLELNFAGSDVIDFLFLDGAAQPSGTWGGLSSGAQFTTPLITGSGLLQVAGLPGDYNDDGTVDTADYIVWRKSSGSESNYHQWQDNFGKTDGGGSASHSLGAVPEPASLALVAIALLNFTCRRRLRRQA